MGFHCWKLGNPEIRISKSLDPDKKKSPVFFEGKSANFFNCWGGWGGQQIWKIGLVVCSTSRIGLLVMSRRWLDSFGWYVFLLGVFLNSLNQAIFIPFINILEDGKPWKNPRKMDPILQVRSFTVKTCQFPICTVTVWIQIGQKQIVSFKHVRLHLLKYGKLRLNKLLHEKLTYLDPLKNAGKGRQAFSFEMVPFQLSADVCVFWEGYTMCIHPWKLRFWTSTITQKWKRKIIWTIRLHDFGFQMWISSV